MSAMAPQIIGVSIVCSIVGSGTDQRKHQISASLAFVRAIHLWPVNSPHKSPGTRKMFPFDDVIMMAWRHFLVVPQLRVIHQWLAVSPHKGPVMRSYFAIRLNKPLNKQSSWDALAFVWRQCDDAAARTCIRARVYLPWGLPSPGAIEKPIIQGKPTTARRARWTQNICKQKY